ncbi:lecithin retinol acyltransferase b, tandem duplicate 2 [Gambusia affinis]|uniref:lecithin retinol acyltransferase b, tandem duplicate 2 n=1 Tax=Gambusia affinis TaxID=33528 RepID=UPI001CDD45F4|nr:lecithin retinol acyltransferase b, tandem duplicate 2 [Gambusia affinis]XP_043954858.1 lecithin retinol acyltransferase b, tandem duplicate 2 [Gambusia affinis]
MFSLRLLALIFVSSATVDPSPEEKKKKGDDEEEKNRYDLMFMRGDLLEVPRTLFTHFGIYLGGGRVAHFIPDIMPVVSTNQFRIKQIVTNTRLILGVLAKCGSVRVDSVEDFAYGAEIIVNPMDKMCSCAALQGEEVARRAEKLLGDVAYSLLWYNCEHFVMYCRYGTVMSFQTFQFCKTARKLLLSRGVAKVTAVLAACLLVYLRVMNTWSVLLTVLLPFLLWMAS